MTLQVLQRSVTVACRISKSTHSGFFPTQAIGSIGQATGDQCLFGKVPAASNLDIRPPSRIFAATLLGFATSIRCGRAARRTAGNNLSVIFRREQAFV
jgi:hypothetical protein